jgi:hypothetical protein
MPGSEQTNEDKPSGKAKGRTRERGTAFLHGLQSRPRVTYLSIKASWRATRPGLSLATCVVITTLIVCAGAGATPVHRHPNCFPRHAHTIAENHDVRVYSLARNSSTHEGTYACFRPRGTTVTLSKPARRRPASRLRFASIDHVALAGAIVAYAASTHAVDTGSTEIVVVDVASGRTLLTAPGGGFIDGCFIRFSDLTDLVVTSRGSVAWIMRKGAGCKTTSFEVYSAQPSGAPTLLEEGPAIAPESLRIAHHTVGWENAGQRKSAYLP